MSSAGRRAHGGTVWRQRPFCRCDGKSEPCWGGIQLTQDRDSYTSSPTLAAYCTTHGNRG